MAWAKDVPPATKLSTLISNPNTVLLTANTEGTLITLHSVINLGGSVLHPNSKVVCLISSGHAGGPIIVDEKSATQKCTFVAPIVELIITSKTPTKLEGIVDPSTTTQGNHYAYEGCSTFLPAPWLSEAILASNSNDPFELILVATTATKAFNAAHDQDPAYLITAESHLKNFVTWVMGSEEGKGPNNNLPPRSHRPPTPKLPP